MRWRIKGDAKKIVLWHRKLLFIISSNQEAVLKKMKRRKWNQILPLVMLVGSLVGFSLFYFIPFIVSFFYSIVDSPIHGAFCGLQNYKELLQNPYFLKGLKNTVTFMVISIPLNMVLSLVVAFVVQSMNRYSKFFSLIFLIPLAIPSATSAFFWESFWGLHGTFNKVLRTFEISGIDWLDSKYSMIVMVNIFIWKNIGYNMALYLSGLSSIPEQYYEYADVEGAGTLWKFKNITWLYLIPTTFLALIMTFVNSFKVFKEIYIIIGKYPPDGLYVLQHYMNNMFLSLNYSKLASAVYILTMVIVLFVACLFRTERKLSKNLHY